MNPHSAVAWPRISAAASGPGEWAGRAAPPQPAGGASCRPFPRKPSAAVSPFPVRLTPGSNGSQRHPSRDQVCSTRPTRAAITGAPRGTVLARVHRGRKALALALREDRETVRSSEVHDEPRP